MKLKQTDGFWSLAGTRIYATKTSSSCEATKEEVLTILIKPTLSNTDLILKALKSTEFKRGKTYKAIAAEFNVRPEEVFKIRKANNLI